MKIPFFNKSEKSTSPKAINPFDNFRKNNGLDSQNAAPIFVTGVGRSGSHFLSSLYSGNDHLDAYHLDEIGNPTADSFLFYANWYQLPMDYSGFFHARNHLINKTSNHNKRLLESNPYLALFTKELSDYYPNGKIIILLRDPRKVVLSHYNKGWYTDYDPSFSNWGKAPFYQYEITQPNHFFGRFFPNEEHSFKEWSQLTQVGKISWMWQAVNNKIKRAIQSVDQNKIRVVNIDHFNYDQYLALNHFLELDDGLSKANFDQLVQSAPGHTVAKTYKSWGKLEEEEFQLQINKFEGFTD